MKIPTSYIPLHRPTISKNDLVSVLKCLVDEKISGDMLTADFEKRLNRLIRGRNNVVALSSASAGFYLILKSMVEDNQLKAGDEIILSPLADAWLLEVVNIFGLTPIWIDLELGSFKMSTTQISEKLSHRTKAVVISHHFGYPFDLTHLSELDLAEKGVMVIEDQTALLGTAIKTEEEETEPQMVGLEGDVAFYCFEPKRMITTGKGGAVVCRNKKLAKWIAAMRGYQLSHLTYVEKDGEKDEEKEMKLDQRLDLSMNDLNAALGISELVLFHKFVKRRQEIRQYFCDVVMKGKHSFMTADREVVLNGYSFPLLLSSGLVRAKEVFSKYKIGVAGLKEGTIYERLSYDDSLPVINELELKLLQIPIYPTLSINEIEQISKVLASIK